MLRWQDHVEHRGIVIGCALLKESKYTIITTFLIQKGFSLSYPFFTRPT